MKTQFKNPVKNLAPIFLMLATMFLMGFGCNTSKPTPDPLAGWHFYSRAKVSHAITADYQDYIQKLPRKERDFVGIIQFSEDGIGQHAAQIEINLNGTYYEHVLIYDRDDKRIKVIKYIGGRYRS